MSGTVLELGPDKETGDHFSREGGGYSTSTSTSRSIVFVFVMFILVYPGLSRIYPHITFLLFQIL